MKKRIIIIVVACLLAMSGLHLVRHCNRGHRDRSMTDGNGRRHVDAARSHLDLFDGEKRAPGTASDRSDDGSPVDIALLHSRFPGNRALPPLTETERARLKNERAGREKLFARINSNRATVEEIHHYYREQEEIARDGIVLASYILQEYDGRLGAIERKKQEFMIEQFKKRLILIPRREKEALERSGKH